MLGRFTSRKMRSGVVLARTWLNSIQLEAVRTEHPSRSSSALPSFRTSGLSSRIRTDTFERDTAIGATRYIHCAAAQEAAFGRDHARHGGSAGVAASAS